MESVQLECPYSSGVKNFVKNDLNPTFFVFFRLDLLGFEFCSESGGEGFGSSPMYTFPHPKFGRGEGGSASAQWVEIALC